MEEETRNRIGFILFIITIFILGIGGYFLTRYLTKQKKEKVEVPIIYDENNSKIDKNKDFIYFENQETISEEAEIYFQDVVINIKNQEELTEALKKENEIYKNSIQYITDQNILSTDIISFKYDNLYSLLFRKYDVYKYNNYISLVLNDYNYSCFDFISFYNTKSYIFDIKNNIVLKEDDILNKYNITIDEIKEKVREYLNSKQSIENEIEVIKVDETINDFKNYSLFIDEVGKLKICFLVKTNKLDYNETMEVGKWN